MISATLKREYDTPNDIFRHIRECDRMYNEVYGRCPSTSEYNACRKLLKMGFQLNSTNLPELCILHCERWNLPTECNPVSVAPQR